MLMRYFPLLLLCAGSASARQTLPSQQQIAIPRMILTGDATPVTMQRLNISADISGGLGETTVTMTFFNPNSRPLEGNLQFPLADGQQITGFALDINGAMRPAVPVDKARGREVFEQVERQRVDPGLLEVTQGNNFKLRVFPIPAQGTRTVELRYSQALLRQGNAWDYRLPLAYGAVQNFDMKIRVNDAAALPQASGALTGLAFVKRDNGYEATLTRENINTQGALDVVTTASAQASVYRQQVGDEAYFVAEVPVKSVRTARPAPRVIGLLWDSSGSGATRMLDAELTELDHYLRALGNVEVRLTRLRDRPEAAQTFRVQDGNWSALRSALEHTVYDGATALNDFTPDAAVDQYLLFSDGLTNYGGKLFPTLAPRQQLFTLNSSVSADSARLAALAEGHGGELIAIDRARPGAAAQTLLLQEARVENISATGATDIEVDAHTIHDGMLRITGRLLAPQAALAITLLNGGQLSTINLPLPATAPAHPRAAALWASMRLRALEADFEAHRSEIGRIGRRFAIPTRETSLIVLEQISDYVRYEIEPPSQYAKEYEALSRSAAGLRNTRHSKHLDSVVRMFKERKQWWARSFPVKAAVMDQQYVHVAPSARATSARIETILPAPRPVERYAPAPIATAAAAAPAPAPVAAPAPALELARQPIGGLAYAKATVGKSSGSSAPPIIGMALQKWVPNAPYMRRLQAAKPDQVYQVYLDQKADYANSTAFYLDAADILSAKGKPDLALRVLSNLAEMDLENRAVLRILGYRLLQARRPDLAVPVFEEVQRIAQEEPQSFRDLGLALAAAGHSQEAIDSLYEVATRPWDERFPDIESIALAELNAIVATSAKQLDTSRIDPRLLAKMPLDVRVVLTWDADNSDMDLHVIDPSGERCFYGNNATAQGGRMTRDFTGGYGPEEFSLRRARPGKYKIEANYYGSRQQIIAGATTLQVKMFTGFGTTHQKEQLVTLRLKEAKDTLFVGEFEVR